MNGAVSKVNNKFISHPTRAKRTPSAAATVPSFSCATSSLMLTAVPRGQFPRWRCSRKRLSVCSVLRCPDLWLQCSVSFVHGLEKTHYTVGSGKSKKEIEQDYNYLSSLWQNIQENASSVNVPSLIYNEANLIHGASLEVVHCNHRSGHLKTEHTESVFLLRRHLGNWPRCRYEKWTAGRAWETWTVAAADGVRCARARREINILLIFKTAPFFCVYPVYII